MYRNEFLVKRKKKMIFNSEALYGEIKFAIQIKFCSKMELERVKNKIKNKICPQQLF